MTNTLSGKVSLVTGASGGMGHIIARELAWQGATVVLVCRDARRGAAIQAEIIATTGNAAVDLLSADLSSQAAIRQLADTFTQRYAHLHLLINNAGAHIQQRQLSGDGIEMNLAINHLAAFLLTELLLPTLTVSTPARIVNVASNAMTTFITLDDRQSARNFVPFTAYGQAKLATVLCTYALARRLIGTGVTVNAVHPGITAIRIVDDVAPPLARPFLGLIKRFLLTPAQGAHAAVYLATAAAVAETSGRYFIRTKEHRSVPISYDEVLQEQVWNSSAALVGL